MARSGQSGSGCGCLVLIILAFVLAGGFWEGIALILGGWLIYLAFIGVSIGIVVAIVKAIARD